MKRDFVDVVHLPTGERSRLSKEVCRFGYRGQHFQARIQRRICDYCCWFEIAKSVDTGAELWLTG